VLRLAFRSGSFCLAIAGLKFGALFPRFYDELRAGSVPWVRRQARIGWPGRVTLLCRRATARALSVLIQSDPVESS